MLSLAAPVISVLLFSAMTYAADKGPNNLSTLPVIQNASQLEPMVGAILRNATQKNDPTLNAQISRYLAFLGITASDLSQFRSPVQTAAAAKSAADDVDDSNAEDADGSSRSKVLQRLANSSLQFLRCDFTNWECLESAPPFTPMLDWRQETSPDLGKPIQAGDKLNIEFFFTELWDRPDPGPVVQPNAVASKLAERLQRFAQGGLQGALYGIDDLNGSMKPVADQLKNLIRSGRFQAVFDNMGVQPPAKNTPPWLFAYAQPGRGTNRGTADQWMLPHTLFQYDGTNEIIRLMNEATLNDDMAPARLEYPSGPIMHNKFLVMRGSDNRQRVWTGTANLSNHCMGTERNANMSVFIDNEAIAQAYADEFKEMFTMDPSISINKKTLGKVAGPGGMPFHVGRFHNNKRPNTHRYFVFGDHTEVRVHFAPTDDGEHRAILPFILSAKPGDILRIGMFGNSGFELVRALQFAIANGVDVRILVDKEQGAGNFSWFNAPLPGANLFMPNPYVNKTGAPFGRFDFRRNNFDGKFHEKIGTLTRRLANGAFRPEAMIIGSQNWSSSGNDSNDENMISIQNLQAPLPIAQAYNDEFDRRYFVPGLTAPKRPKQ